MEASRTLGKKSSGAVYPISILLNPYCIPLGLVPKQNKHTKTAQPLPISNNPNLPKSAPNPSRIQNYKLESLPTPNQLKLIPHHKRTLIYTSLPFSSSLPSESPDHY
ncbi:hypothetical protein PGTUg99_029750 [Puccinia graminis f. sp. tritici]|uniref:Uncharacterized protein n=1 Tax=Puccinia graminis f. sp. tritici TaxID=56615 RepID=A0A5B0SD14_PUCGR|nr:hypothetical protein PGTUg99_029750 [Puccinia graminis f. sp. tritici]